jgi:hypothetical protein
MELEVKASKRGFRVCVIFDLDENGEIRPDTKRFVVVGPGGRIYYPEENTIDAAIAMCDDLDSKEEALPNEEEAKARAAGKSRDTSHMRQGGGNTN